MASKKKQPPTRPTPAQRLVRLGVGSAMALLVLLVAGTALLTPDCQDEGCPTLASLEAYQPPEPPRVYDRHGELVGQLAGPRRLVVPLSEVPPLVQSGFVAVEDRRFFDHGGVDLIGIVRAAVRNLRSGGVEEGASTITMQLVRNVFEADVLDYNRWRRKLTEVRMALALEDRLAKDRILELYLNQIYLGGGVWGVETAARNLFGKSVSGVTPGEAALLVGLAKNPEGYSPRRNPERALERRDLVLDIFEREGVLTPEAAAEARAESLEVIPNPRAREVGAWYLAAVERDVRKLFPDPRSRQGLRVHTGYDSDLQAAAVAALREQIAAVEGGDLGPYPHEVPGEELSAVTTGASPYLQGMVVAMDPETGLLRALVGGRDLAHSEFDRALQARRQPGSAFKPLVYSVALEKGLTLADSLDTGPVVVHQAGRGAWSPDDAGDGRPMTVREALARSSNTAAVRVGQWAGVEGVAARARALGISTPIPPYPSVFLGSAEVVPVELVAAYAAFGNGGRRVVPHLVTRIESREGDAVRPPGCGRRCPFENVAPTPVMDPAVAYLTLDAMRGVVDGGTGWRVRQAGFHGPAAGKTGTTDEGRDAWFVGLTPDLAAGVWLGFDAPRPILPGASGGALAAPVWGRLAAEGGAGGGAVEWKRPEGVVDAVIDRSTGYLAGEHCPEELTGTELYIRGTEPTVQCPVHEGGFFDRIISGVKKIIRMGG